MQPSQNDRERWDRKCRESPTSWREPDPFLLYAFSKYIQPTFPKPGLALDLAGGSGRHAIWLAGQGWEITLIDISETGVEQARQNAGPLSSRIHFVVDDLSRFLASGRQFDLVIAFFYLDRKIFPEIVKCIRPGGFLVYRTLTRAQLGLAAGPRNPDYLLEEGELPRLVQGLGLQGLHYCERMAERATAELVARRDAEINPEPS